MTTASSKLYNTDPQELSKFDELASSWWDPSGQSSALHGLNPLRLAYIKARAALHEAQVLDVGCGGGILSESLVAAGAKVTAIDAAEAPLSVARLHALESGLKVDYRHTTAEALAEQMPAHFSVLTCMELLEHVPDPHSVIMACAKLVKPGGHLFFSTLNRTPKAYGLAILGAEYLLRLLPKGTHDYQRFIKPSELTAWARSAEIKVLELSGMGYNPVSKRFHLSKKIDVNYLVHAQKL